MVEIITVNYGFAVYIPYSLKLFPQIFLKYLPLAMNPANNLRDASERSRKFVTIPASVAPLGSKIKYEYQRWAKLSNLIVIYNLTYL